MNINELIETLEDLRETYGEDLDVRIASQPSWPFENEIAQVVVAEPRRGNLEWDDEDEGYYDETGNFYTEDDLAEFEENNEPVAYIAEGRQIGYLPSHAKDECWN